MASDAPQCFHQTRDLSRRLLGRTASQMCPGQDSCLVVGEDDGYSRESNVPLSIKPQEQLQGKAGAFELHRVHCMCLDRAQHRDGVAP
ncbi:hypothetical protein N7476_004968 [Penicillium atrosanguineum]|uniref:Uncharacterized protein n=1 Tax=Penicillium atrosanguineum TaxID=1132637 RepID=A0A9W9PYG1_9EURO|nr:hypothetical protein N7476_004968 [Penicillium atrosanguineum]